MKKYIFAGMLLALIFSACAGENREKKTEENNSSNPGWEYKLDVCICRHCSSAAALKCLLLMILQ